MEVWEIVALDREGVWRRIDGMHYANHWRALAALSDASRADPNRQVAVVMTTFPLPF